MEYPFKMDTEDENISTLLSMGFPDIGEICRALRRAKNDLNEAVAILTNEQSLSSYNTVEDLSHDVEMKDVTCTCAPPPYSESTAQSPDSISSMEFPVGNLYELEARVFTEQWSIPYKREESLGKCLIAAARLAEEGLCEVDENCRRFVERCMPEAFRKLLSSSVVHRWGQEIQEGIFNMTELFLDLITARLKHDPVPINMLTTTLATAFDPKCEWNQKNNNRQTSSSNWEALFGEGQAFAESPSNSSLKDICGWLVDLINKFGERNGFSLIQQNFKKDNLDAASMAALLLPFGKCAKYLNPEVVCPILSPCMGIAMSYVKKIDEKELKSRNILAVSELLTTLKCLCIYLWPQHVDKTNILHLDIILRMLKTAHFNTRMNALKEIIRLVEESDASPQKVSAVINSEQLADWMVTNQLLSIALEGNIDYAQYTDRIKVIVEFLGPKLSTDELTKIWQMQEGQNSHVVDNIYIIMAAATTKFGTSQFDYLLALVQKKWQGANDRVREKLLSLIGQIGKEIKLGKAASKVLDLLWDLAHLPSLPTHLIEKALNEHLYILNDVPTKDQMRKSYILRCVEDIKKGQNVLPAIRQLHNIARSIAKGSGNYHKPDKTALHDLNKSHEVVKLLTTSLSRSHKLAVQAAADFVTTFGPETLVDCRYTHQQFLTAHLDFLQFLLKEADLYLSWNRCKELWETLVVNPDACELDKECAFNWFSRCLSDLEADTQSQLFREKLLKLDPAHITLKGFNCFKTYFENVNVYDNKLKRIGTQLSVEKLDPTGVDYLWHVALDSHSEEISSLAIDNLLDVSYLCLSPRLKKDPVSLHRKFINNCYKKLEGFTTGEHTEKETDAKVLMGTAVMSAAMSSATQTLTAMAVTEATSSHAHIKNTTRTQNIQRLLLIAERYIASIEECHPVPRTILPHGASFRGQPIMIQVICESFKMEFSLLVHSNESVWSVKQKIAVQIKIPVDQLHFMAGEHVLVAGRDQRLLVQVGCHDGQVWLVKSSTSTTTTGAQVKELKENWEENNTSNCTATSSTFSPNQHSYNLEQERMLPGVVMAAGGNVFEMSYQLAESEDPGVTDRVKSLLSYIPTDPAVLDALDSISTQRAATAAASTSPKLIPRSSPTKKTQTAQQKTKESSKEIVKDLFDTSANTMTPFRVLYNLEVLSSKLMPTVTEAVTQQSIRVFCEDFLNVGGLNLVLNVLQRDALPSDVDYNIRQSCYFIALQLTRFLLCGQTITDMEVPLTSPVTKPTPPKKSALDSSVHNKDKTNIPVTSSSTATEAIQTMGENDFTEIVSCLMRVAWAAAAGKLFLASLNVQVKESSNMGYYIGSAQRSRQSSTGSNTSTGSEGENQALHAGVCAHQTSVSMKDSLIAREALEILVTCLQLRSQLISSFYSQPLVKDFIIDTLLGSPSAEVRRKAGEQFFRLGSIHLLSEETFSPQSFLLQVLLKARVPLWVPSSSTRGTSQRLVGQCAEYFDLICKFLQYMKTEQQQAIDINAAQMIEDEIAWLQNFSPSSQLPELHHADGLLLTGHLHLIRCLLTCEGVNKLEIGKTLVPDLSNFLFPASKLIAESDKSNTVVNATHTVNLKFESVQSRVAAYKLLVELAQGCRDTLEMIVRHLIFMHHRFNPDLTKEFEYEPVVEGKSTCPYVGLKNAGATCYMNSVIQQLYLVPGVREAVLGVEETNPDEDHIFYQFQTVLGHLLESQLQYYVPEKFWKCFRLWDEPVNVREQQDAFEFFTHLVDQVDEKLQKMGREKVFSKKFEGIFLDQKICKDCPHRYEREQAFMALNLTVKSHNLVESLDQFVKGELLEGDNAYFCEKCGKKRNTIKRMCIKTLPPVLVIQLKRFYYDWEANRSLKFDDYFQFPWVVDMSPYTADGIQQREDLEQNQGTADGDTGTPPNLNCTSKAASLDYELVGVVVHSGQANAGHYYSYIKERRGDTATNPYKGKWFKFNDTTVELFDMNDGNLEAECFGGTYKAKSYDSSNTLPEIRQRYWNGYILFYDCMQDLTKTPRTPRKSTSRSRSQRGSTSTPPRSARKDSDSLMQLSELLHHGEKQGIFMERMPAQIQQLVREENLRFMQNRDVYSLEYFTFIQQLCSCNTSNTHHPDYAYLCVQSLILAVNFLFNTYFHIKQKQHLVLSDWVECIDNIVINCKDASVWLVEYLASDGLQYFKPFLLECSSKEVRYNFAHLVEKSLSSYFKHGGLTSHTCLTVLLENLLNVLDKEVADHCKTCSQFFWLLSMYAQLGPKQCSHLFSLGAFQKLVYFLLGPLTVDSGSSHDSQVYQRRWSSIQAKDFGDVHSTLACLIVSCDMVPYRTCGIENYKERQPNMKLYDSSELQPMPSEVQDMLYGKYATLYVREVMCACREMIVSISLLVDMLSQVSFCCKDFSTLLLGEIMRQYSSVSSHELMNLSYLLQELLDIEDPLQFERLQCVIEGFVDEHGTQVDGMLTIVKRCQTSDSRRSYQCIKFLVNLASRSSFAKDFLLQTPAKWQWAVNWLKQKMAEYSYWSPHSDTTVSNDNSSGRTFQRTTSAQVTLEEATALLTEFDAPDMQMDTDFDLPDLEETKTPEKDEPPPYNDEIEAVDP